MTLLQQFWRWLIVRGVAAVIFGILALAWPGLTVLVLVLLFGAYAMVDGISSLVAVLTKASGTEGRRGWFTLIGVISVAAAIVTFAWPGITALALLYVIAAWAIAAGTLQLVAAIQFRKEMTREWLLALRGVLDVVVGIALFIWPGAGVLAITWLIGWFAIVGGVFTVAEALRVRGLERTVESVISPTGTPMRPSSAR
ncbi:MAG: hypothetical protein JWM12_3358 [Ilumatobacteraceae bacterium]|nr:hypothetical protein [Ilumatobacteraceae bacterium]